MCTRTSRRNTHAVPGAIAIGAAVAGEDLPRQVGLVAGIELVKNWRTREPFMLRERVGIRVCEAMAKRGVLTRPVGNVIVLMPPYCTSRTQLHKMIGALRETVTEIF